MKHIYILLIATMLISSCKNDTNRASENTKSKSIESNDPYVQSIQKLLQGTWINLDEKGVKVVFENNTRIEKIEGSTEGKPRYFEISDGCKGDIPGSDLLAKAKAKYISLLDINMCFYIVHIDKDYLDLKVIGRGNIIRYKKEGSTVRHSSNKALNKLKTKNN